MILIYHVVFSYHSYSLPQHIIFALSSNLCLIIYYLPYHLNITQIQIHNIMTSAISIIVHLFLTNNFQKISPRTSDQISSTQVEFQIAIKSFQSSILFSSKTFFTLALNSPNSSLNCKSVSGCYFAAYNHFSL